MGKDGGITPKGAFFLAALVLTGWYGLTMLLTPCLCLALLPFGDASINLKSFYRRTVRLIQWAWMGNVALLLEYLFGMNIHILGSPVTKLKEKEMRGERGFWVCNHRTRIDWMLLWNLAFRTGTLDHLRIVLKAPLRQIPIFGWAMQHFTFIFLSRRWADDQVQLDKMLKFFVESDKDVSFLLFPEGTDLSPSNLEKSAAFAKKNDLTERKYSLYPRTTGWAYMFPRVRGNVDALYDITMLFVDHTPNERPSEKSLVTGRVPRTVYFYIDRIDVNDIPVEEKDLIRWLEKRFEMKEAILKNFYECNRKLPEEAQPMFEKRPADAFFLVAYFWLMVLVVSMIYSWNWFPLSVYLSLLLLVGYFVNTFFFDGVDGLLLHLFK